jgi:hypothetical protein
MSMGGRRQRNPFGSWQERTIRRAELDSVEDLQELLEDTGTVEISESLAIWDLYGVATEYDTDTISGEDVLDRVEEYPDDYTIEQIAVEFEQPEHAPVEYEIALQGVRRVDGELAKVPDTKITGVLDPLPDLDETLEERYRIEPERLSRAGPYS